MVKMNDFNDLYVLFFNRSILHGASVASQRLFVFYLCCMISFILRKANNENPSQMFPIFTKNVL